MARLYAEDRAAQRAALLSVMFLSVLALGTWGWVRVDQRTEAMALDRIDTVYRGLQLFALGGGEVVDPPYALQLARFLAPMTTAGAVAVLLSTERHLQSFAARTARGHVVAIGPSAEVTPFLLEASPRRTVVHVLDRSCANEKGRVPDAVRVVTNLSNSGWIRSAAAERADDVIIATGDDVAGLRLLHDLLNPDVPDGDSSANRPRPPHNVEGRLAPTAHRPLRVTVVLQNRSFAITAAIQQALTDPERSVRVVCRWDRLVDAAVRDVVAAETEIRPVALVGDGELTGLFTWHLHRRLLERYELESAHVAERLVLADITAADAYASRHHNQPGIKIAVEDVAVLSRNKGALAVVFVGDRGGPAGARAYEWASRRTTDNVWFLASDSGATGGLSATGGNLRVIDALSRSTGAVLRDPWERLAAHCQDRTSAEPATPTHETESTDLACRIRRAAQALGLQPGYRLEASSGERRAVAPLPEHVAKAVATASGLALPLCYEFPSLLSAADITVHNTGADSLASHRGGLST